MCCIFCLVLFIPNSKFKKKYLNQMGKLSICQHGKVENSDKKIDIQLIYGLIKRRYDNTRVTNMVQLKVKIQNE